MANFIERDGVAISEPPKCHFHADITSLFKQRINKSFYSAVRIFALFLIVTLRKPNEMSHGVDAGSGYVHTVEVTAANAHDLDMASQLIREDDDVVYGDAGYLGIEKRQGILEDKHKSGIDYRINQRPGKILALKDGPGKDWFRYFERQKSSVRSKVEHPFHIIKDLFGYRKVAYRGLAKNHNRLYMLFLSANLWMCAKSGGWRTA